MPLADSDTISSLGGLVGLYGLIITGAVSVITALINRRGRTHHYSDNDEEGETESTRRHRHKNPEAFAANITSEAILDWIETNTIAPLRKEIVDLRTQVDEKTTELVEVRGRLTEAERHVGVLMDQLGQGEKHVG